MTVLQENAIFGWDTTALPAYAYLLGILKDKKTGIELLRLTCKKNDLKCANILKTLTKKDKK